MIVFYFSLIIEIALAFHFTLLKLNSIIDFFLWNLLCSVSVETLPPTASNRTFLHLCLKIIEKKKQTCLEIFVEYSVWRFTSSLCDNRLNHEI